MSNKSSQMKQKGGVGLAKRNKQIDDMATLMTAMEATLMEWEVWFRLINMQKISLERNEITKEELEFFINDGPPFTDLPGRIMASIRKQIPDFKKEKEETPANKPEILDKNGMIATNEPKTSPKILGANGLPNAV
jgi:hypothetical protein